MMTHNNWADLTAVVSAGMSVLALVFFFIVMIHPASDKSKFLISRLVYSLWTAAWLSTFYT